MTGACGADLDSGSAPAGGGDTDSLGPAPLLCNVELRCDAPISDEPKVDCALRVSDGAGAVVFDARAGVERRGRSSQAYDKPNYGLELRDAAGNEASTDLLGMGGESDFVLDGSWMDRSFLRNELAFAWFRSFGAERWAPRGRYCRLSVNDEAQGLYRLGERIKADDDRIDIPDDDGTGQSFVIKQDDGGALRWDVGEQAQWKLISPREERASDEQKRSVQAFLDQLDDALRDTDPADATRDPFDLLDLDALVDFVIVQELAKSVDAYNLSLHLWKAPGAPAQLVPWDFDLSMGQPTSSIRAGNDQPSGWCVHRTQLSDAIDRLPAFRTRFASRWRELRAGPLAHDAIFALIDRALTTLTPQALEENFAIWPLEDVDFQQIFQPYMTYRVSSYDEEVAHVKAWLEQRLVWIDENVDRYPDE